MASKCLSRSFYDIQLEEIVEKPEETYPLSEPEPAVCKGNALPVVLLLQLHDEQCLNPRKSSPYIDLLRTSPCSILIPLGNKCHPTIIVSPVREDKAREGQS